MTRAVLLITILFATTGATGAGAGKKMYDEFVENGQIYPHEGWQEYVTSLGQELLQHASSNAQKYRFIVLNNAQINAFATPDAFIFVNRGLLAFLSSEEQLAAVIGHEIGHVVGEHARRRKMANLLGKNMEISHLRTYKGDSGGNIVFHAIYSLLKVIYWSPIGKFFERVGGRKESAIEGDGRRTRKREFTGILGIAVVRNND